MGRDAKAYWDSPTEAQEVWELRKMGYFKMGQTRGQPTLYRFETGSGRQVTREFESHPRRLVTRKARG